MECRAMCAQESRILIGKAPHRRAEGIRPLPQVVLCSLLLAVAQQADTSSRGRSPPQFDAIIKV